MLLSGSLVGACFYAPLDPNTFRGPDEGIKPFLSVALSGREGEPSTPLQNMSWSSNIGVDCCSLAVHKLKHSNFEVGVGDRRYLQ